MTSFPLAAASIWSLHIAILLAGWVAFIALQCWLRNRLRPPELLQVEPKERRRLLGQIHEKRPDLMMRGNLGLVWFIVGGLSSAIAKALASWTGLPWSEVAGLIVAGVSTTVAYYLMLRRAYYPGIVAELRSSLPTELNSPALPAS